MYSRQVNDKSSGIRRDELSMTLMRHATSKKSPHEDFGGIHTWDADGYSLSCQSSRSIILIVLPVFSLVGSETEGNISG